MPLDPEFLVLLMETFTVELGDQLQQITDGLLQLEKAAAEEQRVALLNGIFRAAHNIKGASRGVDATQVSELAHGLESLFMAWRAGLVPVQPEAVDLSLRTLDHIRDAAAAEREGRPVGYDREHLLAQLEAAVASHLPAAEPAPAAPAFAAADAAGKPAEEARARPHEAGGDAIRVPAAKLQRVSALTEELQVAKIAMAEHFAASQHLNRQIAKLELRLQGAAAAAAPDRLRRRQARRRCRSAGQPRRGPAPPG